MTNGLLAERLWPSASATTARNAILAIAGSLAVAVAAQISVPMFPVPMTLQTLAVLAIGAAFGARLGAATLVLYALEGAVGLPVFANLSGGFHVLVGPTAGYIVGFILAAAVVGYFAERGWSTSIVKLSLATLLGAALIYVPGLLWLAQFTGAAAVFQAGLIPFVPGDIVKAILAALALPAAHMLIGRRS